MSPEKIGHDMMLNVFPNAVCKVKNCSHCKTKRVVR